MDWIHPKKCLLGVSITKKFVQSIKTLQNHEKVGIVLLGNVRPEQIKIEIAILFIFVAFSLRFYVVLILKGVICCDWFAVLCRHGPITVCLLQLNYIYFLSSYNYNFVFSSGSISVMILLEQLQLLFTIAPKLRHAKPD